MVFLHQRSASERQNEGQADSIIKSHRENLQRLTREGKLIVSGGFEGGGGILIFGTTSQKEVDQWLNTDPAIRAGYWHVEILPFTPRVGSVCRAEAAENKVAYSFVRYDVIVSKFTASTFPQILKKHDDYVRQLAKTGNVVAEGEFPGQDSMILIMQGEVDRSVFESDPGVQEGLLEFDIQKLWVAKGSFCEK